MEIGIKVAGKLIKGELTGTLKSWNFYSDSEYFIQHFPSHSTDAAFFLKLYNKDNPIKDTDIEAIYDELLESVVFFLDRVPDAFTDNKYKRLFKLAAEMSVTNKVENITYICAPVEKEALHTFKEKYFPENIHDFRPSYQQQITIYEIKTDNVPYSDETEYHFHNVYGKYIIPD